ncbi:arginine--tRNA ligase [Candidatus Woesearchaeota archaeon]|nr:arginine--tRNA ligase [Candidatus Woesearchaeota archaeon]
MFRKEVIALLSKETKLSAEDADKLVEVPPDPKLGDYAFPCFSLAKAFRKAPQAIAQEIAGQIKLKPKGAVERIEAVGSYINFFISQSELVKESFKKVHFKKNNKTVVLDYSSPNIAKPFGIGHLRSTVIGAALKRVYEFAGWKAVGINHLGDWGTQFGKLIVAYKKWPCDLHQDPIKKLLDLYVKFHSEAEKNPSLEDEARLEFKKLEDGDKENMRLWKEFRELSLEEFKQIYKRLDVEFDSYAGEAFYNDKMDSVVDDLKKKGLLVESEGAFIVDLKDEGIETPAIILKKDGSTIYTTRDLAAILYRKKHYHFDRILYEVGSEQTLHFKQLFSIIRKMGYSWEKDCFHVSHGLYMFETGKMSTRKGQVIFIEDVLKKAVDLSLDIIKEKNPDLKGKEKVAEKVGIGAILFYDLKNDRNKDILFDWDEVLDFEGETGPYIQYTHARLKSILRKSKREPKLHVDALCGEEEAIIARKMLGFEQAIEQVIQHDKPHILARHVLDLAQMINGYYQRNRIIQDDKKLEEARLALIEHAAGQIKLGLSLLGIDAPEEM